MSSTNRTVEKDDRFFKALAAGSTVGDACEVSGYQRRRVYEYKDHDPEFASRWKLADDAAVERMEKEADRRAIEGTLKPVFHKGDECGYIREFSDTLLIFRLKGKRPDVYRDNVQVQNSGEIKIHVIRDAPVPVIDDDDD